jgi:hypothetical protein
MLKIAIGNYILCFKKNMRKIKIEAPSQIDEEHSLKDYEQNIIG